MNINNIQKAIAIMERAKARDSVYMPYWQTAFAGTIHVTNEETFHACGNKACFGGHIAISPEFQADGGSVHWDGAPKLDLHVYKEAVASWLGISEDCADHFIHGVDADNNRSNIYPVPFEAAQAEHVIAALNQLLELGEEKCLEVWPH